MEPKTGRALREMTLQLESGPLQLQAVSPNALSFLDAKYGLKEFYQALNASENGALKAYLADLTPERDEEISTGLGIILNYCLTWGVAEDPPKEDLDLLAEMGVDVSNAKIARLYWLRLIRLDDQECVRVQNMVRALTNGQIVELIEEAGLEES